MSFRSATKEDVSKSGFLYVRNTTTQEITKVASVSNFQVGLIKSPANLTITGDLNVSGDAIFEGIVKYNAGLSGSLTRLADDTSYLVAGSNITITSASNGQVTISAAATSGAPIDASYVVLGANGDLTSERILTAGSGISIVDSGAGGNVTISATGGTGDVVGPASATDNAIARFNLTTGKLIQNSGVTIDDSDNVITPGDIAVNGGDITTTSATFNLVNAATTINLGSTAVVRSINIGTGGAAQTISIGNFAVGTTTSVSGLTLNLYSSGGTVTIDSAGTGGTVNIDNFGYNSTVNVGTGAAVKTVTVGSTNTTSTTSIQGGTGGISLSTGTVLGIAGNIQVGDSTDTYSINVGLQAANTAARTQTINLGHYSASGGLKNVNVRGDAVTIGDSGGSVAIGRSGAAVSFPGDITVTGDAAINGGDITTTSATFNLVNAATTINLGSTAVTRAINIGSNATNVQTIGIGNGAAANIITVGSTTGAASLTLQAGTGNFSLTGAAGTTYTIGPAARTGIISIGNSTATNTIEIGDGSIASGAQQTIDICGANITNNASAYRVINIGTGTGGGALGVANFLTQNRVLIGKVVSGAGYTAVAIQGDYIWIGKDGTTNPTSSLIGFFGATPVAKQTVASDTLANLYTALRNYGLIV